MGLNPKRMRSSCEYVQCEDPNKQKRQMECPDNHAEWERVGMDCQGKVVKHLTKTGAIYQNALQAGNNAQMMSRRKHTSSARTREGSLLSIQMKTGALPFPNA